MSLHPPGYNPMRWDCEKQGCFNKVQRPRIEEFADCFPGRISFGDLDGIVEINSCALILEWKSYRGEIPTGQQLMYTRLTSGRRLTVLIICGDAVGMNIEAILPIWDGKMKAWQEATLAKTKDWIRRWVAWAQTVITTHHADVRNRTSNSTGFSWHGEWITPERLDKWAEWDKIANQAWDTVRESK